MRLPMASIPMNPRRALDCSLSVVMIPPLKCHPVVLPPRDPSSYSARSCRRTLQNCFAEGSAQPSRVAGGTVEFFGCLERLVPPIYRCYGGAVEKSRHL